jgi:hypothetical protein
MGKYGRASRILLIYVSTNHHRELEPQSRSIALARSTQAKHPIFGSYDSTGDDLLQRVIPFGRVTFDECACLSNDFHHDADSFSIAIETSTRIETIHKIRRHG